MANPTGSQALKAVATEGKSLKPMDQIKLKIEGIQRQLAAAIPATMQRYLTPERLTRLFWQEARRNPTLLKCEPETVASGLMTAAQLGIEIGVQGQGWLVPYFNSKSGRHEAQFIIGYKGLIGLARRSGEVLSVETHIVYEKDTFKLKLGINTEVEHEPYLEGDRGQPKLTYGVARFKDGGYHFEWMAEVEIQRIKSRSKASKNGPWVTDEDQMRRKTVIRRMANYLPMSIEFANALTVDDATNEGNRAVIAGQFVEVDEASSLDAPAAGEAPKPEDENQALAQEEPTLWSDFQSKLKLADDAESLDFCRSLMAELTDVHRAEANELISKRAAEIAAGAKKK